MKAREGKKDVKLHSFLTSIIDVGECLDFWSQPPSPLGKDPKFT
jgi:hypothetical protein